jgi:hypothetical protein
MVLSELYADSREPLWRYALRLTRDPDRAEDLVPETFMRAMTHVILLSEIGAGQRRAWLYRVLKNLFLDGEQTLRAARFDYLDGRATLVVFGELAIDPNVEPRMLADRLAGVHNFGEIRCTPEQMGALEARLVTSEGELQDSAAPEETTGTEPAIGNANYLAI